SHERLYELLTAGIDPEGGTINAAQLFRASMHVNPPLLGHWRFEPRIGARRHLAQARADREQHIRRLDALGQLRVDADAAVARVVGAAIVEQVLAAERRADREPVRFNPSLQTRAGLAVPAAAA